MANWLERARREIQKIPYRPTASTDERTLTAVMAVPDPGLCEKSAPSIGSNGSTPPADFTKIEAAIHRLCDARGDGDGNRVALLSDVREYPPERWPWLIGYFNAEAAKYGATSGADDDDRRHCAECANLTSGGYAWRRGVAKSQQA